MGRGNFFSTRLGLSYGLYRISDIVLKKFPLPIPLTSSTHLNVAQLSRFR